MNMSNVVYRLLFVTAAITVPAHAQIVLPAATVSSNAGGTLTYDDGIDAWSSSESRASRRGDAVHVEQSTGSVSYEAGARAAYGSMEAYAATEWVPGGEWPYGNQASASASAQTNDFFVITGGSGVAAAGVNASIEGALTRDPAVVSSAASGYEFRLTYEVVQYPQPCWFEPNTCTPADNTQWIVTESRQMSGSSRPIRVDTDIETDFLFRYDQPFRLNAYLSASGGQGGDAEVAAAVSYFLDLPAGAVLTSASGIGYIAAVPEPGTYALLLLGLAGLGLDHRRRARRNHR